MFIRSPVLWSVGPRRLRSGSSTSSAELVYGNVACLDYVLDLECATMSRQDDSIDALVARLADGDRSVFTQIFRVLWPPTLRLCRTMLNNDADASDAAQEAMEKIFARASDYDRTRPAIPWALAIAGWECRTTLRKRARRRETSAEQAPEPASENVEEQFARRDLVAAAVEAMGELSDSDREVLIATFAEESLDVSGATFRKRRERALRRLREAFGRLYGLD